MDRRSIWLVVLAAVAAHASALWGDFIWLDHAHIEQGLALAPAGEWLRSSHMVSRAPASTAR